MCVWERESSVNNDSLKNTDPIIYESNISQFCFFLPRRISWEDRWWENKYTDMVCLIFSIFFCSLQPINLTWYYFMVDEQIWRQLELKQNVTPK